jgi:hypothetical protein
MSVNMSIVGPYNSLGTFCGSRLGFDGMNENNNLENNKICIYLGTDTGASKIDLVHMHGQSTMYLG